MNVIRRAKTFHLRKSVPRRYASIEPRKVVWISLHTDSESIARQKAPAAWSHMVEAWEARLAGDSDDAERRFEAARELAQVRGYRYMTADRVAKLPREEFLERVRAVVKPDGEPDRIEAAAVLGGAKEPAITVERALELFWTLAKERTIGKSEDQLRRWKNPRIKAIGNFVRIVGNKDIAAITADDMLDFREWWIDRLASEGLAPNSANKDLIHVANTLKTVNQMKRLGLALPLGNLSFKDGKKHKRVRPPFSVEWIKTKLLAPGALDGLNTEARCIVLGMVNTGYRPSEAAGLMPEHIRLDHDIPHIAFEPVGRQLKNDQSRRVIPLTGISLEAFRACPKGFPTYRFKDKVSDTVNKFLRENGLLETPDHVLYSLRHAFEDRMLAAGIDERIRRDIFGHRLDRERYGAGATLQHKRDILQAIAF
jgi:integrase